MGTPDGNRSAGKRRCWWRVFRGETCGRGVRAGHTRPRRPFVVPDRPVHIGACRTGTSRLPNLLQRSEWNDVGGSPQVFRRVASGIMRSGMPVRLNPPRTRSVQQRRAVPVRRPSCQDVIPALIGWQRCSQTLPRQIGVSAPIGYGRLECRAVRQRHPADDDAGFRVVAGAIAAVCLPGREEPCWRPRPMG